MSDAKKTLTITLQGGSLKSEFEGPWNGKDVTIVWRRLYKQYKLHQRSIRRKYKADKTAKIVGKDAKDKSVEGKPIDNGKVLMANKGGKK